MINNVISSGTAAGAGLLRRARGLCAGAPADLADITTIAERLGVEL
ncbi:hypothetical protein AB0O91_30235 [Kitasatospora sp. NPDC089797]